MVFSRKRKDNRSSSFILDDSPKRSKVQAQRKFAQTSNVNSPALTPVPDVEIQEKVMPEPIELLPMKRPNTEDFLTFLCFRGTPVLPPSLSFFNNASMTEGPPPLSESASSSKNGVILPANISKTQGEKPFIAFGVRKRADPVVVSRHMDKKRRHALALQALRRKYQEQKMAKIRAITISKLSEKVHTNKTVVRTTRSITKAEPTNKKNLSSAQQKTKITVVATKHVKVTTRRSSTIKQSTTSTSIKQKMCLRNLRNRVIHPELTQKLKRGVKQEKIEEEEGDDDDDEEDEENDMDEVEDEEDDAEEEEESVDEDNVKDEDEDYISEESDDEEEEVENTKKSYQSRQATELRVTRSNIIATRRNKRLLLRQKAVNTSPTSPRLRSQLRRKLLQTKVDKAPLKAKRLMLTRQVQLKASRKIQPKPGGNKPHKLVKETQTENSAIENRTSTREMTRKRQCNALDELKTPAKNSSVKAVKNKPLEKSKKIPDKKMIPIMNRIKKEDNNTRQSVDCDKNINKDNDVKKVINEVKIKDDTSTSQDVIIPAAEIKMEKKESKIKPDEDKVKRLPDKIKKEPEKINELVCKPKNSTEKEGSNTIEETINDVISSPVREDNLSKILDICKDKKILPESRSTASQKSSPLTEKLKKISPKKIITNTDKQVKATTLEPLMKPNINITREISSPNISICNLVQEETKSMDSMEPKSSQANMKKDASQQDSISKEVKDKHMDEIIESIVKNSWPSINLPPLGNLHKDAVNQLPQIVERNKIVIDKDVIIEELIPFKQLTSLNIVEPNIVKVDKADSPKVAKKADKKPETKTRISGPKDIKPEKSKLDKTGKDDCDQIPKDRKNEDEKGSEKSAAKGNKIEKLQIVPTSTPEGVSQRPARKTKLAAAIYMEMLGRKLTNDDDIDDVSIDSFPELPNVRRMEQQENELRAKMIKDTTKPTEAVKVEKKPRDSDEKSKTAESAAKGKVEEKRKPRKTSINLPGSESDDQSFAPPSKFSRQARQKSASSSSSEAIIAKKITPAKKTPNATASATSKSSASKKLSKKAKEDSFSESDEEPLVKLTQQKPTESDGTAAAPMVKQKRECAKRPQNYLPLFSSSDEEEKFFRQTRPVAKKKVTKPEVPALGEALSTKDLGRRFGKGKVNMSNEQIEKWLNDSALAGVTLIKAENDAMLKFGERIPTETSLDGNLSAVNMEHLKNSLLSKTEEKDKSEPIPSPINTTPDKSTTSSQKPLSNEKKPIFRKAEHRNPRNSNAFSACNESSVYAFEADNEDSVSTPFRRPSRRPSSTATSRSEDDIARVDPDNKPMFRLPTTAAAASITSKVKQEVSLMLTDESNNSGSITVQVNLETADNPSEQPTPGDSNERVFFIPFQPGQKPGNNIQGVAIKMGTEGAGNQKLIMSAKLVRQSSAGSLSEKATPMFPPSSPTPLKKPDKAKASCSMSETSDDFKYKVPSSPSASSSSSAKLTLKKKTHEELYKPINCTEFPNLLHPARIVDAPIFRPTEKEFVDPLEYIEKIRATAEKFGICRIIPPGNFKPECKVLDEMRFTAYNQYVHKMMHRWGPNFRELVAIRKYLATQNISLKHPPWIGGIEVDLPKLYQIVQSLGGLTEVIEKKKWPRVSELMKIPKSTQDKVTKLDDMYCKYLLPYDTLSPDEREKLFTSVETDWAKRESKVLEKARNGTNIPEEEEDEEEDGSDEDDESEGDIECIVKGRSMALSAFYRIARNTMAMWFTEGEPSPPEVEEEFWKHVIDREHHICVHSGSIDSGNFGYGFAVSKNSPFARHAWNLKVLTNNSGSVLRSMGPVMGLTVPTLHVGMLYAGCCWYRDPHSLPWIEYLHTGANKIWYGIPDAMSDRFHETMLKHVPQYCLNKSLWLPTDTVMVPPSMLVDNGVALTRTVQEPGQFVVVFPKAFTSNICAGYVVSESVFWAPPDWLNCADKVFLELRNSCEPSMFSYERLLLSLAEDPRTDVKVLRRIIPPIQTMIDREKNEREKVRAVGIKKTERLPLLDAKRKKKMQDTDTEYICEDCRWNLYCSMICDTSENAFYCLEHALEHIKAKRVEIDNCKLMYTYDDGELNGFVGKIHNTIEAKLVKKVGSKFAGMATLLNR